MSTCEHDVEDGQFCMLCCREGEGKPSTKEDPNPRNIRWGGDDGDPAYGDWSG